jgi:DNA-binding CsgD family transcriptional regulator
MTMSLPYSQSSQDPLQEVKPQPSSEETARKYVPGIYWIPIILNSVVGTLITDNLGVALETASVFAVALGSPFQAGYTAIEHWEYPQYKSQVAAVRRALPHEVFAAEWADGEALSFAEAIAEAVADNRANETLATTAPNNAVVTTGLTSREGEVLRLLAGGLSDREIAESLSTSPRTVGGHVTNLLGKLGVDSRTAAVALAIRQGLARGARIRHRMASVNQHPVICRLNST